MVRNNTRGSLPAWEKPVDQGSNPCVPTPFEVALIAICAWVPVRRSVTSRVPHVSRTDVVWSFAPCDVDVRSVPCHPVVVAVREIVSFLGLVVEPSDETRHLDFGAPCASAILRDLDHRGKTGTGVAARHAAVVRPCDVHMTLLVRGDVGFPIVATMEADE